MPGGGCCMPVLLTMLLMLVHVSITFPTHHGPDYILPCILDIFCAIIFGHRAESNIYLMYNIPKHIRMYITVHIYTYVVHTWYKYIRYDL